jgi:2-(1,2-epoxy-1,2-dihydrophenyl)acetyl-CoA isomerase
MSREFLKIEQVEGVVTITLDRPEVLNSFHRPMAAELQAELHALAERAEVRAMILTGAGRAFCAGQDLAAVIGPDGNALDDLRGIVRECYNPIVRQLQTLPKPVIAAVNGVAAGAGANIALACDFVLASESATFIQAFSKIGLIPDSGGTYFLPRLVGRARATALAMLGEKLTAVDAVAMGLIYRAVPAEQLSEQAMALAQRLAAMPTRGLALTKAAFLASGCNALDAQLDLEEQLQGEAGATEDYREGVQAFLHKRAPRFVGR